jgi:hypothetical protein
VIFVDALIEFVLFLVEGAFYLWRYSDESQRASLLDQSPLEKRARRRRLGLGCLVMLVILAVVVSIIAIAK